MLKSMILAALPSKATSIQPLCVGVPLIYSLVWLRDMPLAGMVRNCSQRKSGASPSCRLPTPSLATKPSKYGVGSSSGMSASLSSD
eukprot:6749933-Heterocapsa_arctica.AAC.1